MALLGGMARTYNAAMGRPIYDVRYADTRSSLQIGADLEKGWRKLQKTYGFFQNAWIPYRDDLMIRAALSLTAQPAGFDASISAFPELTLEFENGETSVHLGNRALTVKVPLSRHQPWRKTKQGRPELFIENLPLVIHDGRWYDLRIWIVFHESPARPIPDVRVWAENNLVVAGGQFESNRRKH